MCILVYSLQRLGNSTCVLWSDSNSVLHWHSLLNFWSIAVFAGMVPVNRWKREFVVRQRKYQGTLVFVFLQCWRWSLEPQHAKQELPLHCTALPSLPCGSKHPYKDIKPSIAIMPWSCQWCTFTCMKECVATHSVQSRNSHLGAGEMAQRLRGLAALSEDQDSIPSIYMAAHNCL